MPDEPGQLRTLLITGSPGVGKTTVVRRVGAALRDRRIGGFVTDEIRIDGRRVGFELCTAAGQRQLLAHVELASAHRVGRYGVDLEALDRIVAQTLEGDDDVEIYLIDEIGKMECLSERFCAAMRRLLDRPRPVLATVALHGGGLIAEVKARDDVLMGRVTQANRDRMPDRIVQRLSALLPFRAPS